MFFINEVLRYKEFIGYEDITGKKQYKKEINIKAKIEENMILARSNSEIVEELRLAEGVVYTQHKIKKEDKVNDRELVFVEKIKNFKGNVIGYKGIYK